MPAHVGPSRRVLLGLIAAVLAVHALLLWGGDALFGISDAHRPPLNPATGAVLNTRRIDAPAPQPQAQRPVSSTHRQQPLRPRAQAASRPRPVDSPGPDGGPSALQDASLQASAPTLGSDSDAPAQAPEGPHQDATTPFVTGPMGSAQPQVSELSPPTEARPAAIKVPPPIRLSYEVSAEVKRLPYQANGEMRWSHDGEQYEAQASIRLFLIGGRSQTSQGRLTASGLAPRRFGDKVRNEQAAHFNAEQGKVTFSANTPDAVLLPGMQDRLSVFMQLASLVAADPAQYPSGTRISLPTVGPRDAETWVFNVDGPETLRLSQGPMDTLKLTRAPRAEFDTRVELWLAPGIHYLPARIRITQANGDYVDQQLSGVSAP